MMKSSYKNIQWNCIKNVGFDMDGTLYDEFDFISQVYEEILREFPVKIKDFMKEQWLEKGSSYPFIYGQTYDLFKEKFKISKQEFISHSLDIYRNFIPNLSINSRVKDILNYCKRNYTIFLISDGNHQLQKRKFKALNLDEYFDDNKVIFTGINPKKLEKPSVGAMKLLNLNPKETLYFGDRDKDENFALECEIQFQKVYNMIAF